MDKVALYVPREAKPGKEKEVAEFLRSALPLWKPSSARSPGTPFRKGPSSFAIFDTFDAETGRDANLNSKVAAALMVKAANSLPSRR